MELVSVLVVSVVFLKFVPFSFLKVDLVEWVEVLGKSIHSTSDKILILLNFISQLSRTNARTNAYANANAHANANASTMVSRFLQIQTRF